MTATCLPIIVWSTVLLWDIYANHMVRKCQCVDQGCTQVCLRDQPPQLSTRQLTQRTPRKGGRPPHSVHFTGVEREAGEICHQGGLSELGLVVMGPSSQPCAQTVSLGTDLGEDFYFSHTRGKKTTFQLPLRELFLPANAVLICLKGTVSIS